MNDMTPLKPHLGGRDPKLRGEHRETPSRADRVHARRLGMGDFALMAGAVLVLGSFIVWVVSATLDIL